MAKSAERIKTLMRANALRMKSVLNMSEANTLHQEGEILLHFVGLISSMEEADILEKRLYEIKDRMLVLKREGEALAVELGQIAHGLELDDMIGKICKN